MPIQYKIADQDEEFQQIFHLNYKTFVEEIPQHNKNNSGVLIDSYHDENTYLIALMDKKVIGMVAVRDRRPFSLDKKLDNLDEYLPEYTSLCEIRLLSVEKEYRKTHVFYGLIRLLSQYCLQKGYDLALISGTVRQTKLYKHMGFVPFAHLVGEEKALYQPMYITKEIFAQNLSATLKLEQPIITFLPGPVPIKNEVAEGLSVKAISHRTKEFHEKMHNVKEMLLAMTGANYVEVLLGSGTLANDCIAMQLSLRNEKGIILANGEFGERLIDHAKRASLSFSVIKKDWGEPFVKEELINEMNKEKPRWMWAVHHETSTGMLNDLMMLQGVCKETNVELCVDCISSIGTVSLDLGDVLMASGVSGKGIGSFTGLSFVFHKYSLQPSLKLPRYLDLGSYEQMGSVPYSHSSNLINALYKALKNLDLEKQEGELQKLSMGVREKMAALQLKIVAPEKNASPAIITLVFPKEISAKKFGDFLTLLGYQLHYESAYLQERNWLQISFIGHGEKEVKKLMSIFEDNYRTFCKL